jgi:galactokinase
MALAEKLKPPYRERMKHLISENHRVELVERYLEEIRRKKAHDPKYGAEAEYSKIGKLLYESHASSRDLLDNSIPELDLLVSLTKSDPQLAKNVYGARLSGGGFGGSVIVLARKGQGPEVARRLAADYKAKTPYTAQILVAGSGGTLDCPAIYRKP